MNKLKVVMAADYPIGGAQINGGVQAVSAYLVSGLKEVEDIDLSIVSFRSDIDQPQIVKEGNLVVHLLPKAKRARNITLFQQDFQSYQDCLAKIRPDLIHAQDASVEAYLSAKSGYPCVITFHGMIGEDAKYKATFVDRMRFRFLSLVAERYCVAFEGYKILISPYVQRYYGSRLKGECRQISNPIRREFFELNRDPVEGRILFAGKIIRRKGVLDLIRAISQLRPEQNFELRIAGSCDDQGYMAEIQALIREQKLESKVNFLGLLNEEQVLSEFSTASILVLPSYQETAPMVIQQAMAANVAVIATRICGVPDQLEDGKAGLLFEPGDVATCGQQLEKLLNDPEYRQALTERARVKAENEFHVDRVVEVTAQYYRDIISRKNSS